MKIFSKFVGLTGALVLCLASLMNGAALTAGAANAPSTVIAAPQFATAPSWGADVGLVAGTVDSAGNSYFIAESNALFGNCGEGLVEVSAAGVTSWQEYCYPVNGGYTSSGFDQIQYANLNGTPSLIVSNTYYVWVFPATLTESMTSYDLSTDLFGYTGTLYAGTFYDATNDTFYFDGLNTSNVSSITGFSGCVANPQDSSFCHSSTTLFTAPGAQFGGGIVVSNNEIVMTAAISASELDACTATLTGSNATCTPLSVSGDEPGPVTVDSLGNFWLVGYDASQVSPSGGYASALYSLPGGFSSQVQHVSVQGSSIFGLGTLTWSNGALLATDTGQENDVSQPLYALSPLPSAPTGVSATQRSSTSAAVSWTASDYAASYQVTAAPGGAHCEIAAPQTSCTVDGLGAGIVQFTVSAATSGGTASAASSAVTLDMVASPTPEPTTPSELARTGSPLGVLLLFGTATAFVGVVLTRRSTLTKRRRKTS